MKCPGEQGVAQIRRRLGCGLLLFFFLTLALHAVLMACHPDMPGDWWWIASCWLVKSSGLLLGIWGLVLLLRLLLRNRVPREIMMLLVSGLVFLWGYRGITHPTEYCLRLWSCDSATIRPTWHISPLKRLYYSMTSSYFEARDGLELWVNNIEGGHNYSPILGHGPCELSFSLYGGWGPHVRDSFTIELPQTREATQVELKLAADTTALGVIVLPCEEGGALIVQHKESPIEAAQRQGMAWLPVTQENEGCFRLPISDEELHFILVYFSTDTVDKDDPPWQLGLFDLRRLPAGKRVTDKYEVRRVKFQ